MSKDKRFFEELGYEITWKPIPELLPNYSDKLNRIIDLMYYESQNPKPNTAEKLKKYIAEFPDISIFWNYLTIVHTINNNMEEALKANEECRRLFPDYLYGYLNHADLLLRDKKYEQIPETFKRLEDLKALQPGRNLFHVSEVMSYYSILVRYYTEKRLDEMAMKCLSIMKDIDEERSAYSEAKEYYYSNALERFKDEKLPKLEKRRSSQPLSFSIEQTTEPPVFNHEIIKQLYESGYDIEPEIITEILALPRESLIEDLRKLLTDSLKRFRYFKENEDLLIYFPIHAMILGMELKAKELLPDILLMLRQEKNFLDFWLAELMDDYLWEVLFYLAKDDPGLLADFMKLPNVDTFAKYEVSITLKQIAFHHPEKRNVILEIYRDLIKYFIANKSDENILDHFVIENIITSVVQLRAGDLLEQIREVFDNELYISFFSDEFDVVTKKISEPLNDSDKRRLHQDIYSLYDELYENYILLDENEEDKEDYNEDEYQETENESITEKIIREHANNPYNETGRNDPCPCGSGKKYKKCCLK